MSVLMIGGDVSPRRAQELAAQLDTLCAVPRPTVYVDMRGVRSLHLAGVNVIVRALRQARQRGGDVVVDLPRSVDARRPFELAGFLTAVA